MRDLAAASTRTSAPSIRPTLYVEPGFTHTVRPILVIALDSWMWPWIPSIGWWRSIAERTAVDPTGISTGLPPLNTGAQRVVELGGGVELGVVRAARAG